jgi:DsbC/DsbD-like thiol-disulfide interchange protein
MVRERFFGYSPVMNRRSILLGALAWPTLARAEEQPWQAHLLIGGFDGTYWRAGLRIMLLPDWKTYWRVPGAAGIAPVIEVQGDNLKSQHVLYPLPIRLKAGEDDVIGYKDEVIFPLLLEAREQTKPLSVKLKAFLGVCDLVCIPARFEAEATFKPVSGSTPEDAVLQKWISKLPQTATGHVAAASVAAGSEETPTLSLTFAKPVADVFIEGKATHYFHAPVFSGAQAKVKISGAKSSAEIRGTTLRLTLATEQGGVEEMVTVV